MGKRAVVIGAGMGGLAAARVVSDHFDEVVVLDRDKLPAEAEPRIGTPQCRQVHVLLGGGLSTLAELFPDFPAALRKAGAVPLRVGMDVRLERPGYDPFPNRDLGWDTLSMTRPLLELVVRGFVEKIPNILISSNSFVAKLLGSAATNHVTGVKFENDKREQEELSADLVIDASSRGNLTLEALEGFGLARPDEAEIGIDLAYATAIFKIDEAHRNGWQGLLHIPTAPDNARGTVVSPIEGGRWHVTIAGNHGDAPPGDIEGFKAFTKGFRTSTLYDAIKDLTPIGEIYRFAFPTSFRRHFERLTSFPAGLIPIGDAVCKFNPAFGQGMSVALQEAGVLGRLLKECRADRDPFASLAKVYFEAIQGVLASPWSIAESDFVYPKTRGQRPPDFEQRLQFQNALVKLQAEDPTVHKLTAEVTHLMKPASALRDPQIINRVMTILTTAH